MAKRLFIFLVLGIFILIADITFNDESDNKITIFESEINSLIGTWVNQVGREPTLQEIDGIIRQLLDEEILYSCLLYTSPSPRDLSTSRMPSSA